MDLGYNGWVEVRRSDILLCLRKFLVPMGGSLFGKFWYAWVGRGLVNYVPTGGSGFGSHGWVEV